jgi:hypothetical protein
MGSGGGERSFAQAGHAECLARKKPRGFYRRRFSSRSSFSSAIDEWERDGFSGNCKGEAANTERPG